MSIGVQRDNGKSQTTHLFHKSMWYGWPGNCKDTPVFENKHSTKGPNVDYFSDKIENLNFSAYFYASFLDRHELSDKLTPVENHRL